MRLSDLFKVRSAVENRGMAHPDAELESALRSLARIIDRYGEAYWPLFERLEAELYARRSRSARLAAYRRQPHIAPVLRAKPPVQEMGEQSSEVHRAGKP